MPTSSILAHRNRSDFCDLRLRCPSQTPEIARFPRQEKARLYCDLRVRWKVASDLRFRAVISGPKTPSFCGNSGDLAPSTQKSLAIAIVRFWRAKSWIDFPPSHVYSPPLVPDLLRVDSSHDGHLGPADADPEAPLATCCCCSVIWVIPCSPGLCCRAGLSLPPMLPSNVRLSASSALTSAKTSQHSPIQTLHIHRRCNELHELYS